MIISNKTDSGYVFPNIPRAWQREERFFALELRNLFDTLFTRTRGLTGDPDKFNYVRLTNKPSINNHILEGNSTLSELGIKDVTDVNSGLMTAALKRKLDGIDQDARDNRPEIDYLSMMIEIDIPTDTANRKTKLTGYYNASPKKWNKTMIWDAVGKWITASDYRDITGETYPSTRPT